MDITSQLTEDQLVIGSYGPRGFSINNVMYKHSVIILPDEVTEWDVSLSDGITEDSLSAVVARADDIDILLLGGGEGSPQLQPALFKMLRDAKIGLEAMDTGAAARTYNVLMAEGRRVAAALIKLR
jgi:uncharacterized protein